MDKSEKFFKLQTLAYNNSIDEKEIEFINKNCAIVDKKLKHIIGQYKIAMEDLKEWLIENEPYKEYAWYNPVLNGYKMYVKKYIKWIKYYSIFKSKLIEQRTKKIFIKLERVLLNFPK